MRFYLFSPREYLPIDFWTRAVRGTCATEIEVGPGDGRFVVEAAKRNPTTVFVAFEIRAGSARRLLERGDLPSNVRVHHCDARWVIEHLIADDAIDAYHFYFPDPWWKKRHQKRRLFTDSFGEAVARTLKPGGRVHLVTDVDRVFMRARAVFECHGLHRKDWARPEDDPAQSSYERKYRRQGRRLYCAVFEKEGQIARQTIRLSPPHALGPR